MNQPPEELPGLERGCIAPVPSAAPATPVRPRVKPVDRSQLTWQMLDVERLIEPDHPARAIWELVGRLKLDGFYASIEALEGTAGRTPWDPRQEEPKRKRAAQERAVRERQQRLEQALEEVQKVRQAKRPQDKEQARASRSDPQARIMKQSDGGYAPSYNVQLSTEASNRVI